MDERYWIVSDCVNTLRGRGSRHMWRLELEVKFLQLRVELLKCECGVTDVDGVIPFLELKLLVQEMLADGYSEEIYRKILERIDSLFNVIREQADGYCFRVTPSSHALPNVT